VSRREPDQLDWGKLRGPYGTGEHIPHALDDLRSNDDKERASAVGFLMEHLWHQGTVYEVTAPAVPFLADAALGEVAKREDRIWLISLLTSIASGTSSVDRLASAAREAVHTRLPEFLARLGSEQDPSLQVLLAELAAQFPEAGAESRPLLRRLLEEESKDPRRLVLEVAYCAVGGQVELEDLFSRLSRDHYDDEEVAELRERLARCDARAEVFRDVLENVVGTAVDVED
jgi:hypothetical protein